MFTHIRNRLTLLYTVLTAVSLVTFILIFYFILSSVLLREQEQEALSLANKQALSFHRQIEKYEQRSSDEEPAGQPTMAAINGDDFYYLLSKDGSIINGKESVPSLRSEIIARVTSWQLPKTETLSFTLPEGDIVKFMVVALPVTDERERSGTVIAAKNLADYDHFLKSLIQVLSGVSLLL